MGGLQKDRKRVLVLGDVSPLPYHLLPHSDGDAGSGNFGTCLADHLADIERDVTIWARNKDVVDSINTDHRNPKYLKGQTLSKNLNAVGPDLPTQDVVRERDVILFAIPTQSMRPILKQVVSMLDPSKLPLLVFVNKGIENTTNYLPLEVIEDECGKLIADVSVFLSGPSFAKEIVARQPTQVSVASHSGEKAMECAELFHQPWFRCYIVEDPMGVELAGAAKNVYAIVSGVATGLGYQSNTRAGLVTRCLAEMTRIGVALGADPLTFLSLAGVGDLFLTCSSEQSRNFTVGRRLGEGAKLPQIIEELGSVAEGVETAKGLAAIVKRTQVDASIALAAHGVLHEDWDIKKTAEALMGRPMSHEHQGMKSPAKSSTALKT